MPAIPYVNSRMTPSVASTVARPVATPVAPPLATRSPHDPARNLAFDFAEAQAQGPEVWTALAPLMDRILADGRAEPDRGFLSPPSVAGC